MRQPKTGISLHILTGLAIVSAICIFCLANTPKTRETQEQSLPCSCPPTNVPLQIEAPKPRKHMPVPQTEAPKPQTGMPVPRKVFHFLKELGYGIGNMQVPQLWDDIDEQRGLLIVDVGACDGSDWSVPASIKRGHTVIAFEPLSSNIQRFMQTVRNNGVEDRTKRLEITDTQRSWPLDGTGQIFLFQACVSNFSGKTTLYSDNELASTIPQDFYGNTNTLQSQEIQTIKLDSIISGQDIHLLKIDTQGNELAVLQGASRLLTENRINIIELEFWPKGMEAGGVHTVDILDYLHQHGFICFDYSRNKHITSNRASDFEGFVASFDGQRDQGFGAWDELICFNHRK